MKFAKSKYLATVSIFPRLSTFFIDRALLVDQHFNHACYVEFDICFEIWLPVIFFNSSAHVFQVLQFQILPHNRFTVACDIAVPHKQDALTVLADLHRKRLGSKRILVMISPNNQFSLDLFK